MSGDPKRRTLFTVGKLGEAYVKCRAEGAEYGRCISIAVNLNLEKDSCKRQFQVLKSCVSLQVTQTIIHLYNLSTHL